jgi:glycosyltransferase involved in cell wall biosynthesis
LRVGIYPAALSVMGGGEKYIGKIAEILAKQNEVAFMVFYEPNMEELETRLGLDLSRVTISNIGRPAQVRLLHVATIRDLALFLASKTFPFVKPYIISRLTRKYDIFINQERETYIPSHSRRSYFICEIPPVAPPNCGMLQKRLFCDPNLKTYDEIVVNSYFTRKWAERYYKRNATVLYPPIDTESFVPLPKENIILSVGRFCTVLHCKNQLEMVRSFKRLYTEQNLEGWSYHLVGGLGSGARDQQYLQGCKNEGEGYPVYFHVNASFKTLRELYGKARIFWHGTGLGEAEDEHPQLMEHFGMTTVEAMSAGCVPIVINKGGQPEIVQNQSIGFLFNSEDELNKYTISLISDEALWKKMSEGCIRRSQEFSLRNFEIRVKEIFK